MSRFAPSSGAFDLLRLPVLGPFLRWRHARSVLQALFLGLAVLVILDGLFGPDLASRNLAGVLPWVHWRGFVVLALLVAGNLFCMSCPFMLVRRLAKRFLPGDRAWPGALRSKWPAVALLVLFFWAYEAFALWASPWLTAWVAVTYFALAFVVDGLFRGAAFCKHLCPIGQFHFVNGMVSPTEVRVRDPQVCETCRTKDCIRGRYRPGPPALEGAGPGPYVRSDPILLDGPDATPRLAPEGGRSGAAPGQALGREGLVQRGCELSLYQPKKEGNLDCTFCMECIHACPHDNVGILLRSPLRELGVDPVRSGVGRITRRPDLAALAAVLVFAAFVNAFGMAAPAYTVQAWIAGLVPAAGESLVLILFFGLGLVAVPTFLLGASAAVSRGLSRGSDPLVERASTYVWTLVPLGLGMWTAHYLFHLLIGGFTIVPVFQDYLADLGVAAGGTPAWVAGTMIPEGWILPVELFFLQTGLLLTLVSGFRVARREEGSRRLALRALFPWAVLSVTLAAWGAWLLLQPMEMRGTI